MTREQAIEQLEEHLLKAIDEENVSCEACWMNNIAEKCSSHSIEAINLALISLRAQVELMIPDDNGPR